MILRPYQSRAIEAVRDEYRAGKRRVVLMLPTGAGKTVCAASMIHAAVGRGGRVLFLVHRRELVRQAVDRLAAWDVSAGVISAGWPATPAAEVQVASIQTLARRPKPPASVVFVDECQHARAESWTKVLDHYREAAVIGLSATPYRLDGRGLGTLFESIVNPVTVKELCELGVLVEPRVLAPPGPDLSGVRRVAGEYDLVELSERMDKLTGNVVEHWLQHAGPSRGDNATGAMRTVMFAVDIAHSRSLVDRFTKAGVRAEHMDGSFSGPARDAVLGRLASGEIDILSNCAILGEGWDLPSLECAILARPTASMALHRQQIGRIMRACDGKDSALVLDHAGNHHRHGLVTTEIDVSLSDRVRRVGEAPTKTCPACYCVCMASATVCPECGHVFEVEESSLTEIDGVLVEFRPPTVEDRTREYASLVARASRWRNRLGWARYKYRDTFGVWPSAAVERGGLGRAVAGIEATYECWGYEAKKSEWGERCGVCCRARGEHGRAVTA